MRFTISVCLYAPYFALPFTLSPRVSHETAHLFADRLFAFFVVRAYRSMQGARPVFERARGGEGSCACERLGAAPKKIALPRDSSIKKKRCFAHGGNLWLPRNGNRGGP